MNKYGKRLSDDEKLAILDKFSEGLSAYRIATMLGRDTMTIKGFLIKSGFYESRHWRRYAVNHAYFSDITTEQQAYWLGFIAADGCVYSRNLFGVALALKDRAHVELLNEHLDSEYQVRIGASTVKEKTYQNCSVRIRSQQLVRDLVGLGVTPRKSLTYDWPERLPYALIRHYVRGYFDGDGCFCVRKDSYSSCTYSFTGSPLFIPKLQKFFELTLDISVIKVQIRDGKSASFAYGGEKNCGLIFDLLYEEATIWLERKRQAAQARLRK